MTRTARASIAFCWLLCLLGVVRLGEGLIVPAKAVAAQLLLERAFDRSLISHRPEKPWPWADMTPAARLHVARLGIERIVLGGGSGQAMAFGPALLPGTAGLESKGTAVIAAHRDTHFRFLRELRQGDLVEIQTVRGSWRRYRIAGAGIVRWDRFALPDRTRGLVLVTCYPFDAVRHGPMRYVLRAVPA